MKSLLSWEAPLSTALELRNGVSRPRKATDKTMSWILLIWGSHSNDYKGSHILGYDDVKSGRILRMFRRNIPLTRSKGKPTNQQEQSDKQSSHFLLVACGSERTRLLRRQLTTYTMTSSPQSYYWPIDFIFNKLPVFMGQWGKEKAVLYPVEVPPPSQTALMLPQWHGNTAC
jgi:hypothetical protein